MTLTAVIRWARKARHKLQGVETRRGCGMDRIVSFFFFHAVRLDEDIARGVVGFGLMDKGAQFQLADLAELLGVNVKMTVPRDW